MTFLDVVSETLGQPELIKQFNHLTGCELGVDTRKPIEKMIDDATGYQKELDKKQLEYMGKFLWFVYQTIWLPLANQFPEEFVTEAKSSTKDK